MGIGIRLCSIRDHISGICHDCKEWQNICWRNVPPDNHPPRTLPPNKVIPCHPYPNALLFVFSLEHHLHIVNVFVIIHSRVLKTEIQHMCVHNYSCPTPRHSRAQSSVFLTSKISFIFLPQHRILCYLFLFLFFSFPFHLFTYLSPLGMADGDLVIQLERSTNRSADLISTFEREIRPRKGINFRMRNHRRRILGGKTLFLSQRSESDLD